MAPPDGVVSCPHAEECPGCPLLSVPYEEQLEKKHGRVTAALAAFGDLSENAVAATVPADPIVGYRERSKLVVSGKRIGLFAKGTHRVVDLPECRVLDATTREVTSRLRELLPLSVPLRAVDLRRVPEGVLATLVVPTEAPEEPLFAAAAALHAAAPSVVGVAVSRREEGSAQVLGSAPISIQGESAVPVRISPEGPYHFAAPGTFSQAHSGQQRALFRAIIETMGDQASLRGLRVLELFAGTSALSLELSSRGASVTSVESFEPSVRLAERAASEQGLSLTAIRGDAAVEAKKLVERERDFDVVIVNPPRRGLSPDLREALPRLARRLAIYVSCEPVTLARDLWDLKRLGLAIESILPHDMMPLTDEVETLTVLKPGSPPDPAVLFEDDALIAIAKVPHESTTPQGEHDGSLLARVRELPGASLAVPVHRLDAGTSGVCLFARDAKLVQELASALAAGEKEYIAVAHGVTRDKGSIRRPLSEHGRPKDARTRYHRRAIVSGHSLLITRPDEGKKHQIRRHLSAIGHPVVGDDRYGDARTNRHFLARHFLDRPFLHCARIRLVTRGSALAISAPLAPDLALVLRALTGEQGPRPDEILLA